MKLMMKMMVMISDVVIMIVSSFLLCEIWSTYDNKQIS